MAFQFSDNSPQYHQPVAPELPGRVAMPQGDFVGNSIVNAFVHKAIADEQAQLQQKQLMQQADLQAQHLAYQDKWQTQDHEIAQQNADSVDKYREQEAQWHISQKGLRDDAIKAAQDKKNAQEKLLLEYTTGLNDYEKTSYDYLSGKKLNNPNELQKNPGDFVVNATEWMSLFGDAKAGATPQIKAGLEKTLKDFNIPYAPGAQLVTATGETAQAPGEEDPNKQLAWRVPGTKAGQYIPVVPQSMNIMDVYRQYQDPVNRPGIERALVAAGHGELVKVKKEGGEDSTGASSFFGGDAAAYEVRPKLDAWATNMLKAFKKTRRPLTSMTPGVFQQTAKQWQLKAGYGAGGSEVAPNSGSDIDTERERANQAISANPAAESAIRAYFEQKNGEPL